MSYTIFLRSTGLVHNKAFSYIPSQFRDRFLNDFNLGIKDISIDETLGSFCVNLDKKELSKHFTKNLKVKKSSAHLFYKERDPMFENPRGYEPIYVPLRWYTKDIKELLKIPEDYYITVISHHRIIERGTMIEALSTTEISYRDIRHTLFGTDNHVFALSPEDYNLLSLISESFEIKRSLFLQ